MTSLAKGLGRFVAALWLVATLIFLSLAWIGGNPVDQLVDPRLDAQTRRAIETRFGYDQSLTNQYRRFLVQAAKGDLGTSFTRKRPVTRAMLEVAPFSMALGALSVIWSLVLTAIMLFLLHGFSGGGWTARVRSVNLVFLVLPSFLWAASMRWLFGSFWGWFPLVGLTDGDPVWLWFAHLSFPALAIALPVAGLATAYLHEQLETLDTAPFVIAALGRGVSPNRVYWRHKLPQVVPGMIQLLGLQLPMITGGALVVECVFGWSGLGVLLFDAALGRDVPLLVGGSLYLGAFSVLGYQLADAARKRWSPA